MGSVCSTVVAHIPRNKEVMGWNPDGCWAFSFLYSLSYAPLTQVPRGVTTTDFPI